MGQVSPEDGGDKLLNKFPLEDRNDESPNDESPDLPEESPDLPLVNPLNPEPLRSISLNELKPD